MEMTRLEQMWRLFGMPGLLMAGALLGMLLVSALPELFPASLRDLASVPLLGGLAWGTVWWILNAWKLYCWEAGTWEGSCIFCGGHMHSADGVSLCLACSTRREAQPLA